MKGQLAFSSTLSCTSRLNSRLSVVEILNCLSCVSRILNIVSTVKCLSTPCRRLSLIFRFSCSYLWWKRHFNADASIIHRFLRMLEDGTYREHREVSYYVDCLCITSKYLSEVLKRWADMPPTIGLTVIQYLIFHACWVISHCRSCRFPICSASRHKPISAVMYNRISVSIRRSTEHKSIQSDVTDDSW